MLNLVFPVLSADSVNDDSKGANGGGPMDFDSLLKQAKAGLRR